MAHLYFAFDVGLSINLEEADRRILAPKQHRGFKLKKSSNKYFKLNPPPLNISLSCPVIEVTPFHKTLNVSEALICEFGAISICLRVPFSGKLEHLLKLSQTLYDNSELIQLARSQFQLNSEILFESVTNAMKLFDDVFLARLYKLSYDRLKLNTWEKSIARKLQTVESIYQKFSDAESTRRLEILEWVIIIFLTPTNMSSSGDFFSISLAEAEESLFLSQ